MHAKADRDEKVILTSYARPPEASVNAVNALKAAWGLLMYDQEGYGSRKMRPVEGERLVDLGRRSRRDLDPTLEQTPGHAGSAASYPPRDGAMAEKAG
jgi:hypothetical protein